MNIELLILKLSLAVVKISFLLLSHQSYVPAGCEVLHVTSFCAFRDTRSVKCDVQKFLR